MPTDTYRILHLVGLTLLLLGLGVILGTPRDQKPPASGSILHGLGLVVMVAAGFGILAKSGLANPSTWPVWVIAKMAIWLVFGVVPLMLKKKILPRSLGILVVLALVATAAWLAIMKPGL
jgi:hypothetical protein